MKGLTEKQKELLIRQVKLLVEMEEVQLLPQFGDLEFHPSGGKADRIVVDSFGFSVITEKELSHYSRKGE